MSRAFFYPPGREKMHALGALDLALWDIRGKALGLPVHAVLGGMARNYCECYNTSGIIPGIQQGMGMKDRARLTIEAGYRAFRMGAADARPNTTFNTRERLNQLAVNCAQAREGVGKNGDWCVDFHQRFDLADAIRGCNLIEECAHERCGGKQRRDGSVVSIPRGLFFRLPSSMPDYNFSVAKRTASPVMSVPTSPMNACTIPA